MADVRIPAQSAVAAQLGRATPLAKPEAVRAAQRAFFEAAMHNAQAPIATPAAVASESRPTVQRSGAEPDRFARPGSLLDIKV